MTQMVLYFVVMAAAMLGLSYVVPGFRVAGWGAALLGAFVLGVVNTLVKPILFILTLPFTILTLGLFLFVLNAICLWITSLLVPGFVIEDIGAALVASLCLAVVGMGWKTFTRKDERKSAG